MEFFTDMEPAESLRPVWTPLGQPRAPGVQNEIGASYIAALVDAWGKVYVSGSRLVLAINGYDRGINGWKFPRWVCRRTPWPPEDLGARGFRWRDRAAIDVLSMVKGHLKNPRRIKQVEAALRWFPTLRTPGLHLDAEAHRARARITRRLAKLS